MGYSKKIQESKEKVYNYAIATKILDLMDKLRMDATNNSERRWVWELLQNAKDVTFENSNVSVEINFDRENSFLEFKHTGKAFTIDNITFLIEQVSTKERISEEGEKPKTTGKFGTGFLTTHLLSEKVDLIGVVKEPDLPYRKFSIQLDRSGREIQKITDSVNSAIEALENLDHTPSYTGWNPDDFNTIFRYTLDHQGIKAAEIGLADLYNALPFTLAFIPTIASVSIPHENTTYSIRKTDNISHNIKNVLINKQNQSDLSTIEIIRIDAEKLSIAIEIERKEDKIFLKKINEKLPRIFCDFPLIGTENFYFPVVVSSPFFEPTEPRDGIYLTDKSESKITNNKVLMQNAVELFFVLLEFASKNNWQNLFHLADIKKVKEKKWLSETWFETSLLKPVREKLVKTPIVDTEGKQRVQIISNDGSPNVYFPYHGKQEVREKIWDLEFQIFSEQLPAKKDIHEWYSVIWSDCFLDTIEDITTYIEKQTNIKSLSHELGSENKNENIAIKWLNSYYDLLNYEKKFIENIINDKYSVIPNQKGDFKKRGDLQTDNGIEEELKNVLEILGQDIRSALRHKKVNTTSKYTDTNEGTILYFIKDTDSIIDDINKIIRENKNPQVSNACDYLISCFSKDEQFPHNIRQSIYDFSSKIWPDSIPPKKVINKWNRNMWIEADKLEVSWMVDEIFECKTIKGLSELLKQSKENKTLKFVDDFISFLSKNGYENQVNSKNKPILPNQNGQFKIKDDLFLDDGEIDEVLKDIAADLGHDFRDELLSKYVYLDLPKSRVITQEIVAKEITDCIKPKFSELPRSQHTKSIFKKLHLWFSKNPEIARVVFKDLYQSKHKLYDDDEIAENMQKVEIINDILSESDLTLDELHELAKSGRLKNILTEEHEPAGKIAMNTQDVLIIFGVTTIDELNILMKDPKSSNYFGHISEPSYEMLQHVLLIIERAKRNIRAYLSKLEEYDTANWTEVSKTVISGIKKDGNPINIVARPSDGGQVIFYYDTEKDTLEQPGAELWVDNDIQTPQQITIGRILKKNMIDKIKV